MALVTDISQLDPNGHYTYADYLTWRFSEYVELIKGRLLRKMAGPSSPHQIVSGNLYGEIYLLLKRRDCRVFSAPYDVRLLESTGNGDAQVTTVVQPDICVVCDPTKIDNAGCLGAPDWIIEVISPSTARLDTTTKFDLYAENGVQEYWIAYPREQFINTYVLNADSEYEASGTYAAAGPMSVHSLPGLEIEWADVFEQMDELLGQKPV